MNAYGIAAEVLQLEQERDEARTEVQSLAEKLTKLRLQYETRIRAHRAARAEVNAMKEVYEHALKLIRSLEWSGGGIEESTCPSCGTNYRPHWKGCQIEPYLDAHQPSRDPSRG